MQPSVLMKPAALVLTALCPAFACAAGDGAFAYDFLSGRYELIGRAPGPGRLYAGTVDLRPAGDGLRVTRRIGGVEVQGTGRLEAAREGAPVLRIRFRERGRAYEETCLWRSDLDNYARITCYLYEPGAIRQAPGIEAFFVDHRPPAHPAP